MLELRTLRDQAEAVRQAIRAKHLPEALASFEALLLADEARRVLRVELEAKQAERNARSRDIGERKRRGARTRR